MSGWQRTQPDVTRGGDVGGDIQVSAAWDARWQRRLADGTTALVTRTFYAATDDPFADRPRASYLECQTEYLVCGDPRDPGGTEKWADYTYTRVPDASGRPDAAEARRAAQAAQAPTDREWSAKAPSWART